MENVEGQKSMLTNLRAKITAKFNADSTVPGATKCRKINHDLENVTDIKKFNILKQYKLRNMKKHQISQIIKTNF